MKKLFISCSLLLLYTLAISQEYHVSVSGDDSNPGTLKKPFRTISKAAEVAMPGNTITVHEGIYREWVRPPRGGTSNDNRIVYRAAEGEKVIIKGSEIIKGWERFKDNVWKVRIPNSLFGDYNPYKDIIHGDWFTDYGRVHHTGEVYLNGRSLFEVPLLERVLDPSPLERTELKEQSTYTWYCESDETHTYIYANFHDFDPNRELVEINVRRACFYPEKTGIDFITVRGFHMSRAATQWAPPTAEQIGLIGTNWSKGWIIEDNVISHSKCTGITLGKDRASGHNIWSKDPSISGAQHYNNLIIKVLQEPYNWSKENIGSHIVRNNEIFNCEQAGICGSMGCAFSIVENNHIHDIWTKRQFAGAEIAGIKFHGAIDAVIRGNRINNAMKGIWLDWMTQGTRVSRNLVYGSYTEDLFVEVNHGPVLADNNLFLSACVAILDGSGGGAYVHNLVRGKIVIVQQNRATPWHKPHSTQVFGHAITRNADNRYYNNIFSSPDAEEQIPDPWWESRGSYGLGIYKGYFPMYVDGNVYYKEAENYPAEEHFVHKSVFDPRMEIEEGGDEVYLQLQLDESLGNLDTELITSEILGRAKVSDMRFENADGTDINIDYDYFGKKRNMENPFPGPFSESGTGEITIKVW